MTITDKELENTATIDGNTASVTEAAVETAKSSSPKAAATSVPLVLRERGTNDLGDDRSILFTDPENPYQRPMGYPTSSEDDWVVDLTGGQLTGQLIRNERRKKQAMRLQKLLLTLGKTECMLLEDVLPRGIGLRPGEAASAPQLAEAYSPFSDCTSGIGSSSSNHLSAGRIDNNTKTD